MYSVKIIKDSMVETTSNRLTTFELVYPRMVHSELLTHRLFSRNSASSRAIPIAKIMTQVRDSPVIPKYWGKNQSGMQAKVELKGEELRVAKAAWLRARDQALTSAADLVAAGLHKQLVNRVMEPWMFITVIVSSTEYENWFALRDHEDAQPEIAWVAGAMRDAFEMSTPDILAPGEWHLPYVELEDDTHPLYVSTEEIQQTFQRTLHTQQLNDAQMSLALRKISTARCARVSYLTHAGVRDYSKDIELHDKCRDKYHWSAFEHVAQAMDNDEMSGNFRGWKQYRKTFANEHRGRKLYEGECSSR